MKAKQLIAVLIVTMLVFVACDIVTPTSEPTQYPGPYPMETETPVVTAEPTYEWEDEDFDFGDMSFGMGGKQEFSWIIAGRSTTKQDSEVWGTLSTDTIAEYTSGNGVEVDGLTIKDGGIGEGFTVAGAMLVDGASDANQLTVQGYTTQTSSLQVWEQSDGTDVATMSNAGAFDVDGAVTLNSTLDVDGNLSSGTGALTVADSLNVTGAADFDSTLNADGNSTLASIDIGGGFGSTGCTLSAAGVLQCDGAATIGGAIVVTGTLDMGASGNTVTIADNDNAFQLYATSPTTGYIDGFYSSIVATGGAGSGAVRPFQGVGYAGSGSNLAELYGLSAYAIQNDGSAIGSNAYGVMGYVEIEETDAADDPAGYIAGAMGIYDTNGVNPTVSFGTPGAKAAIIGVVKDNANTTPHAAVMAFCEGDSTGTSCGNAAFKAVDVRSTGGGDFGYGLDLYKETYGGYTTADIRLDEGATIANATAGTVDVDANLDVTGNIQYGSSMYPLGYAASGFEMVCASTTFTGANQTIAVSGLTTVTHVIATMATDPGTGAGDPALVTIDPPSGSVASFVANCWQDDWTTPATSTVAIEYCALGYE